MWSVKALYIPSFWSGFRVSVFGLKTSDLTELSERLKAETRGLYLWHLGSFRVAGAGVGDQNGRLRLSA